MKRQIIKTKPVHPYRVARAVIFAALIIVVVVIAWLAWEKTHPAHPASVLAAVGVQDSPTTASNAQSPATVS